MKKAIVIGCPGAGKSTFARKLHEKTKLPLFYLDMIYHKPDKTHISREEFDRRLSEIFALDEWIIDGQYARTLERRIVECDTVFFLDYPTSVCLDGAKSRIGKERPEMPWQSPRSLWAGMNLSATIPIKVGIKMETMPCSA